VLALIRLHQTDEDCPILRASPVLKVRPRCLLALSIRCSRDKETRSRVINQ
jgi:hypothetical protein